MFMEQTPGRPADTANNLMTRLAIVLMAVSVLGFSATLSNHLFHDSVGNEVLDSYVKNVYHILSPILSGLGIALLVCAAYRGIAGPPKSLVEIIGWVAAVLTGVAAVVGTSQYGVDSIAHTQYAAYLYLVGSHPYQDFAAAEALARYPVLEPSVSRFTDGSALNQFTYPAGSFLVVLPFVMAHIDARWLYALSALALIAIVVGSAPPPLRVASLALLVAHHVINVGAISTGQAEPLWLAVVLLSLRLHQHPLLSGLLLGCALTIKQLSWFAVPFYFLHQQQRLGIQSAIRSLLAAVVVFAATNVPFALADPGLWLSGVLGPVLLPLPVLGVGVARLVTELLPTVPRSVFGIAEFIVFGVALWWYRKHGIARPGLAVVLPWLPLWFAWRSSPSYFYLLPVTSLFAWFQEREDLRQGGESAGLDLPLPNQAARQLGTLALAGVGLLVGALYETNLHLDDTLGMGLAPTARIGFALTASLLSGAGLLLLVTPALDARGHGRNQLALVVGLILLVMIMLAGFFSLKPYAIDTPAASHHASELLLAGHHPYRDFDLLVAAQRFHVPETSVTRYIDGSFLREFAYPAGSFIVLAPFIYFGLTDVRFVYTLLTFIIALLPLLVALPHYRPLILAGSVLVVLQAMPFIGGGYNEPLWVLPIMVAWAMRDRPACAGLTLGCGLAAKQLAWFFFPFFVLVVHWQHGFRKALVGAAAAAAVFGAVNLPFMWDDPRLWLQSVSAAMSPALPVMGFGFSQAGTSLAPSFGGAAYSFLEAAAIVAALAGFVALGRGRTELALIVPWAPLWFAWRAIYSYYYLLPLALVFALMLSCKRPRMDKVSGILLQRM